MRFRNLIIITLLACIGPAGVLAQGKIIYMNGKEKRFLTAEVKGEFIIYQPEGSTKEWSRRSDKYNVFSILRDDGTEEIIYTPDTTFGGDPTVEELRDFIRGERYAKEYYKKPMNVAGGVATGLAGSVAGFYGIPVPLVYTTVIGQFNPKPPKQIDEAQLSDAYIAGYQRKARNMKIKQSLLGGAIGFGVGITALVLIFK